MSEENNSASKEELMEEIQEILGDQIEEFAIVMEDTETGQEFTFYVLDNFEFEDEIYAIMVNIEEEPEAVLAKVITDEDGSMNFETIIDEEFDKVSAYYETLAEEDEE